MDFLKKSLIRKALFLLLGAFLILGLVDYFGDPFIEEIFEDEMLKKVFDMLPLILFFLFAILLLIFSVHRPLGKVFVEMKAFLVGRTYKKIFTKRIDEMGVLAHFFNDITRNLEKVKIALAEGKRMSEELSVGSDIQRKILPTSMPAIPGIAFFGSMRPASEVGGDSFDVIPAGNNTLIYVGDVTGHGIPAALIMVMVNTIIRTYSEMYASGYDVIVNTNRILKQRIEPRRFMTCVLLRWNAQEQKLYYTGAGHEHLIIFHKKQGVCEVRQTGGIALGMVPDISKIVKEEGIPLELGDFVVLYSDGIIEAKNIEGEMFGIKRLQNAVTQYASTSTPEELFTRISRDFGIFVGEQVQEDDITLIALQRQ